MRWNSTSRLPLDVQFEDIDGGGVVHHPNYLKYLERGRCHAMREIGVPFELCLRNGIAFVVAEVHSKYLAPVRYGSSVVVETRLVAARRSSLKVVQKIVTPSRPHDSAVHIADFLRPDPETYFTAQLRLVTVDLNTGKPIELPDSLRRAGDIPGKGELSNDSPGTDVRIHLTSEL